MNTPADAVEVDLMSLGFFGPLFSVFALVLMLVMGARFAARAGAQV